MPPPPRVEGGERGEIKTDAADPRRSYHAATRLLLDFPFRLYRCCVEIPSKERGGKRGGGSQHGYGFHFCHGGPGREQKGLGYYPAKGIGGSEKMGKGKRRNF